MMNDVGNFDKENEEMEKQITRTLLQDPELLFVVIDRKKKEFVFISECFARQLGVSRIRSSCGAKVTEESTAGELLHRLLLWKEEENRELCVYNFLEKQDMWLQVKAYPPEKKNASRQMFLFFNRTKEHQKTDERCRELEAAKRGIREKGRLLSDLSHEFRTPINAIMGMIKLARAGREDGEKLSLCLEKVENACFYLQELVNDVLDMSRLERGKYAVLKKNFSLSHLLTCLKELMDSQCEGKKLQLVFVKEQFSHERLVGDELGLRRVLLNLLSNAVKYTPGGGCVTFGVREEEGGEGTVRLLFWVKDTGIGISKEFMEHLFEPFQRERKDANVDGSGLGLIISKGIVETMGGRIWATSKEGEGSCFYVELSLQAGEEMGEMKEAGECAGKQERKWEGLAGRKILLVEDNLLNREIEEELLKLTGAMVETAGNGKEGLEKFYRSQPGFYDGILMDIRMPEMNGYETARAIRASGRPDAGTVPVIAMTADVFAEDIQAALKAGMNDHLAKPVDMERLETLLASLSAGNKQRM